MCNYKKNKMKKNLLILIYTFSIIALFNFPNLVNSQTVWYQINPGVTNDFSSAFFLNANTGFVIGESGIIIKTTNGGNSWFLQNSGTSNSLEEIYFADVNTGYVVGGYYPNSIIRKTTNGGNNWYAQSSGMSIALFTVFFINSNTGYTGGDYGNILKTTDGGAIWFPQNSGTDKWIQSIYFINNSTGFAAGRIGIILKTTNGGLNWNAKTSGTSDWLISIKFANSTTGYCVGGTIYSPYNHIILKTTDGGNSWSTQKSGIGFWLESIWLSGPNTAVTVGSNGTILKTTNGGINWEPQNSPTNNTLRKVFFADINTGYITGHNATILKTTNGGMSPLKPVLISPPNGSNNVPLTPTLFWNHISGVTHYRVQVSRVSNFSVLTDSATVTINQYPIPPEKLNNLTTYFWRVNATNSTGTGPWSDVWSFSTEPVGIKTINSIIPKEYNLFQNYPNPFNPTTNIKFDIPKSSNVKIIVYDNVGKEVAKLVDIKLPAGSYEVDWNASNYASGIYCYRIITEKYVNTKKMLLIK